MGRWQNPTYQKFEQWVYDNPNLTVAALTGAVVAVSAAAMPSAPPSQLALIGAGTLPIAWFGLGAYRTGGNWSVLGNELATMTPPPDLVKEHYYYVAAGINTLLTFLVTEANGLGQLEAAAIGSMYLLPLTSLLLIAWDNVFDFREAITIIVKDFIAAVWTFLMMFFPEWMQKMFKGILKGLADLVKAGSWFGKLFGG